MILRYNEFVSESLNESEKEIRKLFNDILKVAKSIGKKDLNGFKLESYHYMDNVNNTGVEMHITFKKLVTNNDLPEYLLNDFIFDTTNGSIELNWSLSKMGKYRFIEGIGLRYGTPTDEMKSNIAKIDKDEIKKIFVDGLK